MNWQKRGGRIVNGVRHLPGCACALVCDPQQTKLAAARARSAEEKARAAALGVPPPAPPRPQRQARALRPDDDRTRRFRELLREHGHARAIEILEAEFTQPKETA
jgi:hypothetical protein